MFGALVVITGLCTLVVSVGLMTGVAIGTTAGPERMSICGACAAGVDDVDDVSSLFILFRLIRWSFIDGDFEAVNKSIVQKLRNILM